MLADRVLEQVRAGGLLPAGTPVLVLLSGACGLLVDSNSITYQMDLDPQEFKHDFGADFKNQMGSFPTVDCSKNAQACSTIPSQNLPAGATAACEAASGNHAVDMRMKLQALIPAMEHAEEADLCSQMAGIACDLKQCLCAGVKEQVVDQRFVLQGQRSQLPRKGEDGMHIAGGQQFPLASLKPAHARVALAPRAMPVSTRVVRDFGRMSAAGAAIAMSAQSGCAAAFDGLQHTFLSHRQRLGMRWAKRLAMGAHNVRNFQCRPHKNARLRLGILDGVRE